MMHLCEICNDKYAVLSLWDGKNICLRCYEKEVENGKEDVIGINKENLYCGLCEIRFGTILLENGHKVCMDCFRENAKKTDNQTNHEFPNMIKDFVGEQKDKIEEKESLEEVKVIKEKINYFLSEMEDSILSENFDKAKKVKKDRDEYITKIKSALGSFF